MPGKNSFSCLLAEYSHFDLNPNLFGHMIITKTIYVYTFGYIKDQVQTYLPHPLFYCANKKELLRVEVPPNVKFGVGQYSGSHIQYMMHHSATLQMRGTHDGCKVLGDKLHFTNNLERLHVCWRRKNILPPIVLEDKG